MDTIDCPKCEHEHQPTGLHEDDIGEMECEKCGFKFEVELEYAPVYSTSCVEHSYGPWTAREDRQGKQIECRFCIYCQRCELREESDS
jgi:Zn ribbon nucleic-acid-binding protein